MTAKIIIACGARRSASTFQYQVAKYLVESRRLGEGIGFVKHTQGVELDHDGAIVLKTHAYLPQLEEHLINGDAIGLHIIRDVRDVIASIMGFMGFSFERAIQEMGGITKERYLWSKAPGLIMRYNYAKHYQSPRSHVVKIAATLGIDLTVGEDREIASRYSVEMQRKRQPEAGENYDSVTLLHPDHIGMVAPGSWANVLTPEEGAEVLRIANQEWSILLSGGES